MASLSQTKQWLDFLDQMSKKGFNINEFGRGLTDYGVELLRSKAVYEGEEVVLETHLTGDMPIFDIQLYKQLRGVDFTTLPRSQRPINITLAYDEKSIAGKHEHWLAYMHQFGRRRVRGNETRYRTDLLVKESDARLYWKFWEKDPVPSETCLFPVHPGKKGFTVFFDGVNTLPDDRYGELFEGMPLPLRFAVDYQSNPRTSIGGGFGGDKLWLKVKVRDAKGSSYNTITYPLPVVADRFQEYFHLFKQLHEGFRPF